MKSTLRLLSQLLVLACIPSLSYFVLWILSAMQEVTGTGVGQLFPFQAQNPMLWKLLVIWWIVGGLCGWFSLFFLYRRSDMHISQIPKPLIIGLGVGIVAALSFPPFPNKYAFAPVGLTLLLLFIARTNPPPIEEVSNL